MSTSTHPSPPSRPRLERATSPFRAWAGGLGAALLGLLAAAPSAERAQAKPPANIIASELTLLSSHELSVSEPSDLALDASGKSLWTVTDRPGKVHQLALDGTLLKTLKFVGDDLEAIAYDASDHSLWVAEENLREVVHLDLEGNELSRHPLGIKGKKNSGIEGLCLDSKGRMFALNEKDPGLFLELDAKHAIAVRRTITFAGDYSAISYDRKKDGFWILSDQAQTLYRCNRTAGVLQGYPLPFPKPEGIAVDEVTKRAYLVSDSQHRLYVFQLVD